jgi:FlaA1/EpsC-like NDP-sugar epimerase
MYAAQFLSGRVALVTGGAGGIGAAVSEALAAMAPSGRPAKSGSGTPSR